METLQIVKIGGNCIDNEYELGQFLAGFASLSGPKLLVHGGGKIATELASKLGIEQKMIDGRRITDAETLEVAVMVYAGLVNKTIVAKLQAKGINAMGFCGADGDLIRSKKRATTEIDYGFVGDIQEEGIQIKLLATLLEQGITPVISPITHNGQGDLLNTNADTIAATIAIALSKTYVTELTYCFEKAGVLSVVTDEQSCIKQINPESYNRLKEEGIISKGMLPKLDNAFLAKTKGVSKVTIGNANAISELVAGSTQGTQLVNE